MKTWLASSQGFTLVSLLAVLVFIGYAFLESRYFLGEWAPGVGAAAFQMLGLLLIVGIWMWGLMIGRDGSQAGATTALVMSALVVVIMLYDIIFYSPVRYGWPLVQIMLWVNFATSVLAAVASGMRMRGLL